MPATAAGGAAARPASRPAYPTFPDRLYSVKAISATDAWAVGLAPTASLIVHWNGRTWSQSQSITNFGFYYGVNASSARDVWAVGLAGPGDDVLIAVTASWTHNIWAVGMRNGTRCSNGGPKCQTLVEHWNGVRWTVLPSPNPPSGYLNTLMGVSAASRPDIWAVGSTDFGATLTIHWNGTSWS